MKKLFLFVAVAAFALSASATKLNKGGDKDTKSGAAKKECTKDGKACCKAGESKSCCKAGEKAEAKPAATEKAAAKK